MAKFSSMPSEVVLLVLNGVINFDEGNPQNYDEIQPIQALYTLNAIARTSKWLYHLTNPVLYRLDDRTRTGDDSRAVTWAVDHDLPEILKRCLDLCLVNTCPKMRQSNLPDLSSERLDPDHAQFGCPLSTWLSNEHICAVARDAQYAVEHLVELFPVMETVKPPSEALGRDFRRADGEYAGILHLAVARGSTRLVASLLDRGVWVGQFCHLARNRLEPLYTGWQHFPWPANWRREQDDAALATPLQLAIWKGQLPTAHLLLSRGAGKIEGWPAQCGHGTAAHLAILLGYVDLVKHMLDEELLPLSAWSFCDRRGISPIHLACQTGLIHTLLPHLLRFGLDINLLPDRIPSLAYSPRSPLELCCDEGRYHDALILLGHGARAQPNPRTGGCLLRKCTKEGVDGFRKAARRRLIKAILASGYDVNYEDPNARQTPLYAATCHGDLYTIRLFVTHGADISDAVLLAASKHIPVEDLASIVELFCVLREASGEGGFGSGTLASALLQIVRRARRHPADKHVALAAAVLLRAGAFPDLQADARVTLGGGALASGNLPLCAVLREYGATCPTDRA